MQISARKTIIDDDGRKQVFLNLLSDQFSIKILTTIINNAKTPVEISRDTGVPISTVYRRLQFLQENKLVKVLGGINTNGKFFAYQSKIKEVNATFSGESIRTSVIPNLNFTIK